jgi:hypothetical protein
VRLDGEGRIDQTVTCERCGYGLRGLLLAQDCPECGRVVALSTSRERLIFASHAWLTRLANGLRAVLIGLLVVAAGAAAWLGVMVLFAEFIVGTLGNRGPVLLLWAVAVPPGLWVAWGLWRLTTPEPNRPDPAPSPRMTARSTTVLLAATAVAVALPLLMRAGAGMAMIGFVIVAVTLVPLDLGVLLYARELAQRLPDPKLLKRTTLTLYGHVAAMFAFCPCTWLVLSAVLPRGASMALVMGSGFLAAAALGAAVACHTLWLAILYLKVLLRLRDATADNAARDAGAPPV